MSSRSLCLRIGVWTVAAILLSSAFGSASWAAPVTFFYQSTTDASAVGGSSNESVNVIFTFDGDLANGTGDASISPAHGSYGPWVGTLQVGTETLQLTGGSIDVFNDAGSTIRNDAYEIRWDSGRGGSIGSLFGSTLFFFRILIVDDDLDMLSSTNLPTDPSFALDGDYIQDDYFLSSGYFGLSESSGPGRSFTLSTLSPVPLPATLPLLLSALAGIGWLATRKKLAA